MKLGSTIRTLRRERKIKQKELAAILGVTPTYMSLIEADKSKANLKLLSRIAHILNVPISRIVLLSMEIYPGNWKNKKHYQEVEKVVESLIRLLMDPV